MFDKLNETCQKELDAIGKQYPFKPLKYLRKTLRLTFEEGVQMLKEAGVEDDPLGDLNTESERTSGKLILEKYCGPPHGGFGAGLERILMLFCGRENIRQTSLFPGDPRGYNHDF
ncbi:class II aminoacyl-tRNA and biotin synthetases superfamily protein [Artemisia annua]|uniref:Class II aminoacyl-tRNA and biotin synthetases superfamily protein n=1 Tax=Artemisia annua TaxID=35608 RepID=A0A2U1KLQ0_ARTAN|nr:class II aminoacyl-tRNA and biotin synthetases superfamily protein [Artemisia annua]